MKQHTVDALRGYLRRLYHDEVAEATLTRLVDSLGRFEGEHPGLAVARPELFDETDVWVIAYGDHVTEPDRAPLGRCRASGRPVPSHARCRDQPPSASSPWFQGWLHDDPVYADAYLTPGARTSTT